MWQTADNGFYDVQDPEQTPGNMRGVFTTDADGRYSFRTVAPVDYTVPSDGPAGELLLRTGRHPWRPAHTHMVVEAPGYRSVITHLFDSHSGIDPNAVGFHCFFQQRHQLFPAHGGGVRVQGTVTVGAVRVSL